MKAREDSKSEIEEKVIEDDKCTTESESEEDEISTFGERG
jgi:hypothetical protein